jgi:hypothetical protein
MYIFYTNYLINVVESHVLFYYTRIILELFRLKRKFIWWYSIVRTNATDLTNEDFDKKTNMILIIYLFSINIKSSGYYNFSLKPTFQFCRQ